VKYEDISETRIVETVIPWHLGTVRVVRQLRRGMEVLSVVPLKLVGHGLEDGAEDAWMSYSERKIRGMLERDCRPTPEDTERQRLIDEAYDRVHGKPDDGRRSAKYIRKAVADAERRRRLDQGTQSP
jgi:hypothetical protein